MIDNPACFELPLVNQERYIRNLSPTIALHLTPEMNRRLLQSSERVIRAMPLKDVTK